MGAGMAANLLKAGHDVTVYNRTRSKVETLVAQGARAAASVSNARGRYPYFIEHHQCRPIGEA